MPALLMRSTRDMKQNNCCIVNSLNTRDAALHTRHTLLKTQDQKQRGIRRLCHPALNSTSTWSKQLRLRLAVTRTAISNTWISCNMAAILCAAGANTRQARKQWQRQCAARQVPTQFKLCGSCQMLVCLGLQQNCLQQAYY